MELRLSALRFVYRHHQKEFVDSGKVPEAARRAKKVLESEEAEKLKRAEQAGRRKERS